MKNKDFKKIIKKEKKKLYFIRNNKNHSLILKMIYLIEIQNIITYYIKQVFIVTYR